MGFLSTGMVLVSFHPLYLNLSSAFCVWECHSSISLNPFTLSSAFGLPSFKYKSLLACVSVEAQSAE